MLSQKKICLEKEAILEKLDFIEKQKNMIDFLLNERNEESLLDL